MLLPQADIAEPRLADELREQGAEVDAVVAYRTVQVEPPLWGILPLRLADAVVLASGSAVRSLAAAGVELPEADQAAPVEDGVVGEVLDAADGQRAALPRHGPVPVLLRDQRRHVPPQVGDAVDAGDQSVARLGGGPVAAERLPVFGKEEQVGAFFQGDQSQRRRRLLRRWTDELFYLEESDLFSIARHAGSAFRPDRR